MPLIVKAAAVVVPEKVGLASGANTGKKCSTVLKRMTGCKSANVSAHCPGQNEIAGRERHQRAIRCDAGYSTK